MVTTKIIVVLAFVMIGVVVSDSTTCGAVAANVASVETCNLEADLAGSCCYQTYTVDTTDFKGCRYVTLEQRTVFASHYDKIVSDNPTWKNYNLNCGLSSSTICTSVNAITDKTQITKESCNRRTDSTTRCCFNSYAGTNVVNTCLPLSSATFDDFEKYYNDAKELDSNAKNWSLDCGQSFITMSSLILALFALLF